MPSSQIYYPAKKTSPLPYGDLSSQLASWPQLLANSHGIISEDKKKVAPMQQGRAVRPGFLNISSRNSYPLTAPATASGYMDGQSFWNPEVSRDEFQYGLYLDQSGPL
jgi:hypothetical protein